MTDLSHTIFGVPVRWVRRKGKRRETYCLLEVTEAAPIDVSDESKDACAVPVELVR